MNEDTINLLKECNNGCKMATNSMEQVQPFIKNEILKSIIQNYNKKHIAIGDKCHTLLNLNREDEKDPPVMAKAFSWISTEIKLMVNDEAHKISELMIDGCHMGIKSVSKYLNQYSNASTESTELAKSLVKLEQEFMNELLTFL